MSQTACLFQDGVHGDHAGHPADDLVTDQQFLNTFFTAINDCNCDLDDVLFLELLFDGAVTAKVMLPSMPILELLLLRPQACFTSITALSP